MRKNIFIAGLVLLSISAISQENMATLSGGYSFANIEDTDVKGTGWRINGLYEFNPLGGMFAHGFSFGYINLSASEGIGQQAIDISVNSFPIYYAPKVMFGNEKVFINAEYEIAYASNSWYKDGWMNTIMAGLGFKF